jgi:hypothetical protein
MKQVRNLSTAFNHKWKFNLTSFKFGANNNQPGLFDQAAAQLERPVAPPQESRCEPDPAAPNFCKVHSSGTYQYKHGGPIFDPLSLPSPHSQELQTALGIFAESPTTGRDLYGAMIRDFRWQKQKGQHGSTYTQLELRRMFCADCLPRNSESRCLAMQRVDGLVLQTPIEEGSQCILL